MCDHELFFYLKYLLLLHESVNSSPRRFLELAADQNFIQNVIRALEVKLYGKKKTKFVFMEKKEFQVINSVHKDKTVLVSVCIFMCVVYHKVKLANISKVTVQCLDVVVDHLKGVPLGGVPVAEGDKVKAGVATEDELVVPPLKEVAEAGRTADNAVLYVLKKTPLVFLGKGA